LTKTPRDVLGADAVKAFCKLDWEVIRIKGSHHHLIHKDYPDRIITIPCHNKPVKVGILNTAIKLAEITVEQFKKLL